MPPLPVLQKQHRLYASWLDHSGGGRSKNILRYSRTFCSISPFKWCLSQAFGTRTESPNQPRSQTNLYDRPALQSQALTTSLFLSYILGTWALKKKHWLSHWNPWFPDSIRFSLDPLTWQDSVPVVFLVVSAKSGAWSMVSKLASSRGWWRGKAKYD